MRGDRDAVAPSWLMKKNFLKLGGNWSTEHKRLFLSSNLFLYSKKSGEDVCSYKPREKYMNQEAIASRGYLLLLF